MAVTAGGHKYKAYRLLHHYKQLSVDL